MFALLLSLKEQVVAVKFLFGILDTKEGTDGAPEENIDYIHGLVTLLSSKIEDDEYFANYYIQTALYQACIRHNSFKITFVKIFF